MEIRPAELADAPAIATIYDEGIEDRVATFEVRPPTAAQVEGWFAEGRPFLVGHDGGEVVAWARVFAYSDLPAYLGVGELSIYVARRARGRGLGRELLEALCAEAERDGHFKLLGKLFADNAASIGLMHACGFRDVGTHVRHGQLDEEWKDVLVVERLLGEAAAE